MLVISELQTTETIQSANCVVFNLYQGYKWTRVRILKEGRYSFQYIDTISFHFAGMVAMIILLVILIFLLLFFCLLPYFRAMYKQYKYWDDPENDPRWNAEQFQFSTSLKLASLQQAEQQHPGQDE